MKKVTKLGLCNRLFSGALLAAAVVLALGCRKPAMSTTDTIRTGNGDSMRYMVPIAVKQDDGSSAYCVYVARPNADMNFFENLGPGRTEGATPVTKNAIPQGQFIQNLRDPEIMKDLGGLGNDMVNDLFTAGSAWMLASAGLAVGAGAGGFARGKEFGDFRKEAQRLTAQLLETDSIIDGELKTTYDDFGKLLLGKKASRTSVDKLKLVLATVKPGSQSVTFYNDFFMKLRSGNGAPRNQLVLELLSVLNTPSVRNRKLVTPKEAESLLAAIGALDSTEVNELNRLSRRLSALEFQAGEVRAGLQRIRQGFSAVQSAARGAAGDFARSLANSRRILESVGSDFRINSKVQLEGLYGTRNMARLTQLYGGSSASSGAANRASYSAKEVAGRIGIWTRRPEIDRSVALDRLGKVVPAQDLKQMVMTSADDFADEVTHGGVKNFLANACLRDANKVARFVRMALCGLAVGAGSLGAKKLLFEPATEPIKREQVAQSFEFTETVQEVNDTTFRRLEETIASFPSEPTALSCQ